MRFFVLASALASAALSLLAPAAQAQVTFANSQEYASISPAKKATRPAPAAAGKIVLLGKITNPAGPLPGAVIILTATREMAVTNAEGEFEFVVPASSGPLAARVTYAGYADESLVLNADTPESTTSLTNAKVIVVARGQQLKTYLKYARKDVKRSLKQVRKK